MLSLLWPVQSVLRSLLAIKAVINLARLSEHSSVIVLSVVGAQDQFEITVSGLHCAKSNDDRYLGPCSCSFKAATSTLWSGTLGLNSLLSRQDCADKLFVVSHEDVLVGEGWMGPTDTATPGQLAQRRLDQFGSANLLEAVRR